MATSPLNTQGLLNTSTIANSVAGWNNIINSNNQLFVNNFLTFSLTLTVQGGIALASQVKIQVADGDNVNVTGKTWVRVRLTNFDAYVPATSASMTSLTGQIIDTKTAGKDLIFETDAFGVIDLSITDAIAETFDVRIGQPEIGGAAGNYTNRLSITHA